MEELPAETSAEASLRTDARQFRIVAVIAAVVALPFVLSHLTFSVGLIPTFEAMFEDMGGELPASTRLLVDLSHNGVLSLLFLLVDVGVFALMYRLARRYWIGLLFVPVPIYLGMTSLLIPVLYMPMFNVISLVE